MGHTASISCSPSARLSAESWYNKRCPETPTYVMGGHLMAYEYPDEFNTRLDQFLDSLDQ